MAPYLVVGIVAMTLTFVTTPIVRAAAKWLGWMDYPSDRKVHAQATPTMGGLALLIGILGAGIVAMSMPEFKDTFTQSSEPLGIAVAALIIVVLGIVDDLRSVPAPAKLAGQVFASGVLFLSGVKMQYLLLPNGDQFSLGDDVSAIITVVWIVAMINATNLIDGLDGLAAGIVAIAAAAFFVYTYNIATTGAFLTLTAPLVAIIIVGAALGFLRYNFHPASIFMGDSGSMLLGLVLGAATVVGAGKAPGETPQVFLAYFPLLIPISVLMIPIGDTLLAIIRRARRRRNVFHADKEHLHHRLMDLGHGHKQAVLVMYVWAALAAGAGLAFSFLDREDVIFALPIAVGAIVLYTLFPVLTKAVNDRLNH